MRRRRATASALGCARHGALRLCPRARLLHPAAGHLHTTALGLLRLPPLRRDLMTPLLDGAALRLRSLARCGWLRPIGRLLGRNSPSFRGGSRRLLATRLLWLQLRLLLLRSFLLSLRLLLLLRLPLLSRLL